MRDARSNIYELILKSYDLDEGDEQVMLLEEAVRLADATGELDLRYETRERLIHAAVFSGSTEKGIVAFTWCLAQLDKYPERFSESALLWKYKWIVSRIYHFPQVSKSQIYEMLDDLSARFQRAGCGLRVIHYFHYAIEKFFGRRDEAVKYFHLYEETPQDTLSNCEACELDDRVEFSIYNGDDERAVRLAAPLLEGRLTCTTVPRRTYAEVLLPLVRLKRLGEAARYHLKGYALIRDNRMYLERIAEHLVFLVLTENYVRALKLFETHYIWAEKSGDFLFRFHFYRAAYLLFDVLTDEARNVVKLRLPETFPRYSQSHDYQPAQLAAFFRQHAADIAARFDRRNETDAFAATLEEVHELKRLRTPYVLGRDEAAAV